MNTASIAYRETGFFAGHILRYLEEDKQLKSFYNLPPTIESFAEAMKAKSKVPVNRTLLVEILLEQNGEAHPKSKQNIRLLSTETTFTVCTGHQLCLFTGPLYFIYKLISTINLAEALKKKYPTNDFIPVYWMASEDHDFEEINHAQLFGKKVEWDKQNATANKPLPAGRIATASLAPLLAEVEILLGNSEHSASLMNLLRKAYLEKNNLAEATRVLVNALLGDYGLVILDADDARLKKEFVPVLKDDIFNNTNFSLVTETIQKLAEQDIKAQVNPRKINVFYMGDEGRHRIEKQEDGVFKVLNTDITFTTEQLQKELDTHPERFSPNVVLRPLYQEWILPNLAYVGGGGELSYWLEYKKMFDYHRIPFPILMLRNSVMLADKAILERATKLGIVLTELFMETESLIRKYIAAHASTSIDISAEETKLKELYGVLSEKANAIDPTLKPAAEGELQKALNGLKALEQKMLRAEKQKQETSVNQLRKLKEKLFPDGELQERYDNFIPYYARLGPAFITALKENPDPFKKEFLILSE
jgi:bacillithiol biosynthesis cysteine-adding enzyme BshC